MVDVSKVSDWVLKAVADIAAFGGKTGKIDKGAEKNALSTLLAGCNKEEDIEYIQGFMIEKGSAKNVENARKEVNTEKRVDVKPPEFKMGSEKPIPKDEYENMKAEYEANNANVEVYFDEDGKVKANVVRGSEGNVTMASQVKHENGLDYVKGQNFINDSDFEAIVDPQTGKVLRNNMSKADFAAETSEGDPPHEINIDAFPTKFDDNIDDPYLNGYGYSTREEAQAIYEDMYNIYLKIEDRLHEINCKLESPHTADFAEESKHERQELIKHEIHLKEQLYRLKDYLPSESN